ncbi:MAG: metallophosphoesterase [Chloroflexi bacterium]|nr:metallophosphoesterase [Chloroflexota bacterium]
MIERLPVPVFGLFLLFIAVVATRASAMLAASLWLFDVVDWLLLGALPRAGKSYGPPQPPALLLALLRAVPAALFGPPWFFVAQALGTALVAYGFWIEPHTIRLTRQTLQSRKLGSSAGLRLLHIGDLHVERITGRERQLVELARTLAPDLILFSGDLLNLSNVDDPVAWEHARAILRELSAPLGVFAVAGSPPVDQEPVVARLFDGLDIRWLRNEKVVLEHAGNEYVVVGLDCTHQPDVDARQLKRVVAGDVARFTILLYHSPDLAPQAAEVGVDLQLSGHTHGGQVRLPLFGALYTSSLYGKRFEVGRCTIGDFTLYVTRGLGMEGKGAPRVRFLCPPEIILWELTGESVDPR